MEFGIRNLAGELMQGLRELILAFSLFIRHRRNATAQGANGGSGWLRPPPRVGGRVVQKALFEFRTS